MKGAEAIIKSLKEEKIENIFGGRSRSATKVAGAQRHRVARVPDEKRRILAKSSNTP